MGGVLELVAPCEPAEEEEVGHEDHFVGQDLLVDDDEREVWKVIFDKYEIGRLLGSGAFGQVRVCHLLHTQSEEEYAVKIVDAEATQQSEVFMSIWDEVHIMEKLQHPHVIRLVDTFQDETFLYVVMELVSGGEFFKAIADPSAVVKERDVARVGEELFEALSYLHQKGIVHRDVKAENIMLEEPPIESIGAIKLIDFGLAAVIPANQCDAIMKIAQTTEPEPLTLICGTPPYAAPELWAQHYGPKVDVWAAGVMLYLALYGKYPFFSMDFEELERQVCDEEPSYEHDKNPYAVSSLGVDCLASLMSKDPADRPSAKDATSHPWFSATTRAVVTVPLEVRQSALAVMRQKPQVSFATEQRRTKALEAKKAAAKQKLATKAKIQTRSLKGAEYSNGDHDAELSSESAPEGGCCSL